MHEGPIITPSTDSSVCGVIGCEQTELLALVEPDGQAAARTLCPHHRVEYIREEYDQ